MYIETTHEEQYAAKNRRHRIWKRIVSALGCIVMFCTTYALILPAITMERDCGMEEHTHTEACYTQVTALDEVSFHCAFESHVHIETCGNDCRYADYAVHSHSDYCYDGDTLICTMPEILEHVHDETCYQSVHTHGETCYEQTLGAMTCEKEETDGHTHGEACYENHLTCTAEEREGHAHGDGCYVAIKKQVCAMEESDTHTHSESCFGEVAALVCLLQEQEGHAHGDDCYESVMICNEEEIEGHEHGDSCYVQIETLTCELDTVEQETVCGKDEIVLHTHEGDCFDSDQILICEMMQVCEHNHDDACVTVVTTPVDTENLTCTLAEDETHTHGSLCYGTWELTCALTEHTHTDECRDTEEEEPSENTEEGLLGEEESSIGLFAYRPVEVVDGGTFTSIEGNEMTWTVTKDTLAGEHTLTIDGEGQMPDFTSTASTIPWNQYSTTHCHVVIGNKVTRIGSWAFAQFRFRSLEWGGVESIATNAFYHAYPNYPTNGGSISIPGTVKVIEGGAFDYCHVNDVELNEGTEKIGSSAFSNILVANDESTYIPSTLTTIGVNALPKRKGYEVAADNPNYCSVDGVLFSKDMATLVDYPGYKEKDVYEIPESVTTILGGALENIVSLKKLSINYPVSFPSANYMLRSSQIEELSIADGCGFPMGYMLHGVSTIKAVRLPEDAPIQVHYIFGSSGAKLYPNLTSFKIPNGTISLAPMSSSSGTADFPALTHVEYDATESEIIGDIAIFGHSPAYELLIGDDVNILPAGFSNLSKYAGKYIFEENTLTVVAEINNKSGTELPSTGGIGTTLFYIVGGIMMATAAVLLVTKKRMSVAE